jgi:DNA-binding CsgD family transcriptional regulator
VPNANASHWVSGAALRPWLRVFASNDVAAPDLALTRAERRILDCVKAGWSNKLAAYSLGLSLSTVGTLLARAREKVAQQRDSNHLTVLCPDELARTVLTKGERSVIDLALSGLTNAAIARQRRSSPRTIANQLAAAYQKLGVGGRRELRARFGR